jgi:hypothetical protein
MEKEVSLVFYEIQGFGIPQYTTAKAYADHSAKPYE